VRYHGEAMPDDVPGWLARAHALVLPSLGENYGYVVAEALEAGRPALVSNETPWHDLQGARAGWTLPLTLDAWRTAIGELRALPDEAYQAWCLGARAHGLAASPTDAAAEATLDVLRQASCGTPLSR
ncbi:MAG: glycosyltransferase, partial [Acidobacteria bacterium]|nr:glycosyltransferase [Acidobacteriota bacterium]